LFRYLYYTQRVGFSEHVTVLLWTIELLKVCFLTVLGLISVLAAAVPLSPASSYDHADVHGVNLLGISFCTACYMAFGNKTERNGKICTVIAKLLPVPVKALKYKM